MHVSRPNKESPNKQNDVRKNSAIDDVQNLDSVDIYFTSMNGFMQVLQVLYKHIMVKQYSILLVQYQPVNTYMLYSYSNINRH